MFNINNFLPCAAVSLGMKALVTKNIKKLLVCLAAALFGQCFGQDASREEAEEALEYVILESMFGDKQDNDYYYRSPYCDPKVEANNDFLDNFYILQYANNCFYIDYTPRFVIPDNSAYYVITFYASGGIKAFEAKLYVGVTSVCFDVCEPYYLVILRGPGRYGGMTTINILY